MSSNADLRPLCRETVIIGAKLVGSSLRIQNDPFEGTEVPDRNVIRIGCEMENGRYLGVVLVLLGRIFVVPVRDRFAGGLCTFPGIGWVLFASRAC